MPNEVWLLSGLQRLAIDSNSQRHEQLAAASRSPLKRRRPQPAGRALAGALVAAGSSAGPLPLAFTAGPTPRIADAPTPEAGADKEAAEWAAWELSWAKVHPD